MIAQLEEEDEDLSDIKLMLEDILETALLVTNINSIKILQIYKEAVNNSK